MKSKLKLTIFLSSMSLCLIMPLVGPDYCRQSYANSSNEANTTASALKNTSNKYFSNYDYEEVLGNVSYTLPEVFGDLEVEEYPSIYHPQDFADLTDSTLDTEEALNATTMGIIRAENVRILEDTDKCIAEGTLGKHKSADGQFFGKIEDSAPRISKKITINYAVSSRHSLGVFAPAGEILTVKIDADTLNQTSNGSRLKVIIGFPYLENTVHRIEKHYFKRLQAAKNRMPILYKEFTITATETKIGSPLGGMVFLEEIPGTIKKNFTITISGGVDNPGYHYGVSSKDDWKRVLEAPSPYAWIQTPYVNFLMPKIYINNVVDPDNILEFWYNASMLSNYAMGLDQLSGRIRPVNMMFDSYIPNGAALAYPGIFAAICPADWATISLDYENMLTSVGCWGTIHEMNHCFQYPKSAGFDRPWTVGDNFMEITNNVMNVLSFVTYTDIASSRNDNIDSDTGWAKTVDPFYNLLTLKKTSEQKNDFEAFEGNKLYGYLELIHSFGAENFIHFLRQIGGGEESEYINPDQTTSVGSRFTRTYDGFALVASKFFKRNMIDYFQDLWKFTLSPETVEEINNLNYDKHFTIQNVYAMGEKGIETGRPYIMNRVGDFTLDLEGKTVTSAEDFEIVSLTNMTNGTYFKTNEGLYTFCPNENYDDMTFDLNYQVHLKDDSNVYERTLKVHFKFAVNQNVNAIEYRVSDKNNTVQSAIEKFAKPENIEKEYITKSLTTDVTSGINLTYFSTKALFNCSKEITFMIYGDDKTLLKINGQTAFTNEYMSDYYDYNRAKEMTENKITVEVEADSPLLIEAYCFNTGGAGNIRVQYSEDKVNYANLQPRNCLSVNASKEVIDKYIEDSKNLKVYDTKFDLQANALDRFYQNGLNLTTKLTKENIKCVKRDGTPVSGNNTDHLIENIIDGKDNTWFTPKSSAGYPLYFVFDFGSQTAISNVNIKFYNQAMYIPTQYKYYIGEEKSGIVDYKEIYSCNNSDLKASFNDEFPLVSGRYFVLEITEDGYDHNNLTSIVDISFSQSLKTNDNVNIYSSSEEQFEYYREWKDVNGSYINGRGKETENGEVTFLLDGTDLLLYCSGEHNEDSYIIIDDSRYELNLDGENSLTFIGNLENKIHTVKLVGKGIVFDAVKTTGEILEQTDLNETDVVVKNFVYDQNEHTPEIMVNGEKLIEGVDYKILSCDEGTDVGNYEFSVEGIGKYKGVINKNFEIESKKLDDGDIKVNVENQTYTGQEIKPEVTVKVGGDQQETTLIKGVDYDVTYSDNIKAGTAKVTITFKGNYSGSKTLEFEIESKKLDDGDIKVNVENQTYTGQEIKPEVTVKVGGDQQETTLIKGVDYDVTYSDNIKAGTAKVTITFKGNYSGSKTLEFEIESKKLDDGDIKVNVENQTYTGQEVKPELDVKVTIDQKEMTLTEGVDYDVTYSNNTKVGTAKVTITFKGNYSGAKTLEFEIIKNSGGLIIALCVSGVVISAMGIAIPLILKRRKK